MVMISIGIPDTNIGLARLAVRFCSLRFPGVVLSDFAVARLFRETEFARSELFLTERDFSPPRARRFISGFSFVRFQSKIARKSQSSRMHELRNALRRVCTKRGYGYKSIFASMSRFPRDCTF